MTQAALFFIVIALSGVFSLRWAIKLAPLNNEFTLKIGLATLISIGLGAALLQLSLAPFLSVLLAIILSLYIFVPALLSSLARNARYTLASGLSDALFWTPEGREVAKRLLAQVALQHGDAKAARELVTRDASPLFLAQVYALEQDWDALLTLDIPTEGDNSALAYAARIEALLARERIFEAEAELSELKHRFEKTQAPLHYRSIQLSEARIAAERGQLATVQQQLSEPPVGAAAHVLYAIAARAAEVAGNTPTAVQLYKQAYLTAPPAAQERYKTKLTTYEAELPVVNKTPRRQTATLALAAALIAAYGVQVWLGQRFTPDVPSSLAAFLMGFPDIPQNDAPWRYLSYGFLHGGVVHIGFNLWVLFDIGRLYEARRGWGNLLAAFVLGTILGAYLTVIAQSGQQLVLVGASGGILGIAGALLADTWRSASSQDKLMTRSLVQWMAIIVVFSFAVPGVSLWGHVGGVVGGLLWGFFRQGLPPSKMLDKGAGLVAIGLMIYAVSSAAALFFTV